MYVLRNLTVNQRYSAFLFEACINDLTEEISPAWPRDLRYILWRTENHRGILILVKRLIGVMLSTPY